LKTALLVPCYNSEKYLVSLKKQIGALDPKFDEVILVDDGSTDRTVEKGRELGLTIEPLGVNRGPGAARNAAVKKCRAEWIYFLDADDEIAPDYLAKALPLASAETDVVLSSCDYVFEGTGIRQMRWSFDEDKFRDNAVRAGIVHQVVLQCSLIRRRLFEACGGFDENRRCWEDSDIHVRLAAAGARFRSTPEVLARSWRHGRGASGNEAYCARCRLEFLEEYLRLMPRVAAADLIGQLLDTATRSFRVSDHAYGWKALKLACQLGWAGPDSRHPLINKLNALPFLWLKKWAFFLQLMWRMRNRPSKEQPCRKNG